MAAVVRGMMKEQHKSMFAALRAGDMDTLLENVCGPLDAARAKPSAEPPADLTAKNDLDTARVVVGAGALAPAEAPHAPAPAPPVAALAPPAPVADAQAVIESMKSLRDSDESPRSRRPLSNPNLRKPTPSVAPPAPEPS